MALGVEEITGLTLATDELDRLYQLARAAAAELRSPPGRRSGLERDVFVAHLASATYGVRRRFFVARHPDVVALGTMTLRPIDPAFHGVAKLDLWVAAGRRREGIGTALISHMQRQAAKAGCPSTYAWAPESSAGAGFLATVMQRWRGDEVWSATDLHAQPPMTPRPVDGLELRHWSGACPDPLSEGFAALHRDTGTSVRDSEADPAETTAELVRQLESAAAAAGVRWQTVAAQVPDDGQLVGFSQLALDFDEPELATQEYTGVHPAWRRRGIGRWLKASMLAEIATAHPQVRYVCTANDAANDAILAINARIGFRPYLRLTAWESTELAGPSRVTT